MAFVRVDTHGFYFEASTPRHSHWSLHAAIAKDINVGQVQTMQAHDKDRYAVVMAGGDRLLVDQAGYEAIRAAG